MRRVTVFGGAGFVGRYVVERLADEGALVTVATRDSEAARFLQPLGDVGQVTAVTPDITDEAAVTAAVTGADAVINLVGILYERGRQRFSRCHVAGPACIARAATACGVRRLVHISALAGAARSAYGRSKAEGEAAVRAAFPAAIVVRPSLVFGPEDQFFNRFARMARLAPALPLIGGGRTRFQPVYVGDLARAIHLLSGEGGAPGQIYEIGGPETASFADLMRRLLALTGQRRLLLPIPFPLAAPMAAVASLLPRPPLTPDQLRQLRSDSVVSPDAAGLDSLGITATPMDAVLPEYLA